MTRSPLSRFLAVAKFIIAEAVIAAAMLLAAPLPAGAQFFDDRFPLQNRRQQQQQPRGPFDWFGPPPQQYPQQNEEPPPRREAPPPPPVDYSRAPSPKKSEAKNDAAVTTSIMVLGDSMADWLAYGLEQAYADSPEIGNLPRHKKNFRADPS